MQNVQKLWSEKQAEKTCQHTGGDKKLLDQGNFCSQELAYQD